MPQESPNTRSSLSSSQKYVLQVVHESQERNLALAMSIIDCLCSKADSEQPDNDKSPTAFWLCKVLLDRLESTALESEIKLLFDAVELDATQSLKTTGT